MLKPTVVGIIIIFVAAVCAVRAEGIGNMENVTKFFGLSDASAAAALDNDHFICADDETNVLRIFRLQNAKKAVCSVDLNAFLHIDPKHPEADIEAAARIGDTIFWISSHGRNSSGKFRAARHCFFATEIYHEGGSIKVKTTGRPRRDLLDAIVNDKKFTELGLLEASGIGQKLKKSELKKLAPKAEGINIESLSAAGDGKSLYIGFRNPLAETRIGGRKMVASIVIALLNPYHVIKGEKPKFSEALLWDLDSLGLRSMEYFPQHKAYFLIAGPKDGSGGSKLYKWDGNTQNQPEFIQDILPELKDFSAEALLGFAGSDKLMILSDDGSVEVRIDSDDECMEGELIRPGLCKNKHLRDMARRCFRAAFIDLK